MFQKTDVFLALARRGHGKSYLAKKIIDIYPRIVIFDTLQEFSGEGTHVSNFSNFCEKMLEFKKNRVSKFKLIFKFDPESENHDAEFDQALRILYYFGDLFIVIEEIQLYSHPHFLPKYLRNCLLTGRHKNLGMLFTTQRPGELNKTILSQCNHIFAGQLHEKNDINYVTSFLGINSQKLISLKKEYFLYFRPDQPLAMIHNSLGKKVETLGTSTDIVDKKPARENQQL